MMWARLWLGFVLVASYLCLSDASCGNRVFRYRPHRLPIHKCTECLQNCVNVTCKQEEISCAFNFPLNSPAEVNPLDQGILDDFNLNFVAFLHDPDPVNLNDYLPITDLYTVTNTTELDKIVAFLNGSWELPTAQLKDLLSDSGNCLSNHSYYAWGGSEKSSTAWPDICQNGSHQSPIDVVTADVIGAKHVEFKNFTDTLEGPPLTAFSGVPSAWMILNLDPSAYVPVTVRRNFSANVSVSRVEMRFPMAANIPKGIKLLGGYAGSSGDPFEYSIGDPTPAGNDAVETWDIPEGPAYNRWGFKFDSGSNQYFIVDGIKFYITVQQRAEFHFENYEEVGEDYDLINDGVAVRLTPPPTANNTAVLHDSVRYELESIVFRTPSEHSVDGRRFPLEMQLIHRSNESSLVAFAVFFVLHENETTILEPLVEALPQLLFPASVNFPHRLNVSDVFSASAEIFNYLGSSTEPPCEENVEWILLRTYQRITPIHFKAFLDLNRCNASSTGSFDHFLRLWGNARTTMPIVNRTVDSTISNFNFS